MKRLPLSLLLLTFACGGPPAPKAEHLTAKSAAPVASASAAPTPDPEPWRQTRPPAGQASPLDFPAPTVLKLKSGLTLLSVRKAVPVASLSLVFKHGAAACPPGKSGLAALTARMLTEGTRKYPSVKLAEVVEQLGSTLDEDAGRDSSSLSLSVLTQDVPRAIELLGEVVTEPAFAPADFERVKQEWLDGLRAERQAPERLASLAGLRLMLGAPHGSPVTGSLKDVQGLSLKDVADFHRKAYGAADATLVVVGDLEGAALQPAAERAFEKLGKGQPALEQPFKPNPPATTKQLWLVDRPGAVQSALLLAQPMPKRSEPGYEGRELLTTVFGGLFTSRLNLNLREEHAYTYGAHAQLVATQAWGAFLVASSVRTDVTADALKEAMKELSLLRDPSLGKPLSGAEVARGRADLVQSIGARLEYGARIGATLSELWVHALPLDYYQKYPSLLAAETPESLAKTALTLEPEHLITVVVGDRAVIEAPLKALGYDVKLAPSELTD